MQFSLNCKCCKGVNFENKLKIYCKSGRKSVDNFFGFFNCPEFYGNKKTVFFRNANDRL